MDAHSNESEPLFLFDNDSDVTDAHSNKSEPPFLFDNDSDVEFASEARRKGAQEPAVNDQTGEADTSEPALDAIAPPKASGAFDAEAYQKESLARHRKELSKTKKSVVISDPAAMVPDIGGNNAQGQEASGDKKPRQKQMKLDEGLLLSAKGFPQLIKNTKDFKLKGKGHEATDLNRLLQIYQFWTHQLHPKTQFRDTALRIEKLCHSRRMLSSLSVWRDEAHGILDVDVQLSDGDGDGDGERGPDDEDEAAAHQEHVTFPSTDTAHTSPPSSRAPSCPPMSDVESELSHGVEDAPDADMDALIQEYSKEPQGQDVWEDPAALDEYFTSTAPPPLATGPTSSPGITSKDMPMGDATTPAVEEEDYWGEDMYI